VNAHLSRSEEETAALGRTLAARLTRGDVVLLSGPLGAGKTAFTRGLADGLGCDPDDVSSPTFAIVQGYGGRTPLQHVDLYRLSPVEVDDLALDELGEDAVMAVEWPDRWQRAPAEAWQVTFELVDETSRRITVTRRGSSALPS
jgi:tRNA threonylcarbamoyladenosine biosynthesis protein TsaE